MRQTAPLTFLILFRMLPGTVPVDEMCDRAQYLLFNRHLKPVYIDSAFNLLARCRHLDPGDERTLYLWSRIHTQMGEDNPNPKEKLRYFQRAKAIAETLIQINPENPDGYLWWGIAQGRIGQLRGVLNSLFMVPDLKRCFSKALQLDSENPTAYEALGVLYSELPGFAGGDLKQAEKFFIQGLKIDPNYTRIRLDLARVYLKQRRNDAARRELNYILKTTNPTYPADYYLEDRPEAENLLNQPENKN